MDSMLIDGSNHKTLLSQPTTGMLDLVKILKYVWSQVQVLQQFVNKDGKIVDFLIDDPNGNIAFEKDLDIHIEDTSKLFL